MPDILLIQPPIRDFYLTAKRTMPYGLASIAAGLRQAGFTVAILDGLATSRSRIISWPANMDYLKPFFGRANSPYARYCWLALCRECFQEGLFLRGGSEEQFVVLPSAQGQLKQLRCGAQLLPKRGGERKTVRLDLRPDL